MSWRYYWQQKNHKRKGLCNDYLSIDSYEIFRKKKMVYFAIDIRLEMVGKIQDDGFHIYLYESYLNTTVGRRITIEIKSYTIAIEKQASNGGHFFHCPKCNRRMRKLYYRNGVFHCRKCLNLSYPSQRISPYYRKFMF